MLLLNSSIYFTLYFNTRNGDTISTSLQCFVDQLHILKWSITYLTTSPEVSQGFEWLNSSSILFDWSRPKIEKQLYIHDYLTARNYSILISRSGLHLSCGNQVYKHAANVCLKTS